MTTPHAHTVREERRRGFQPPWYTVRIYTCADTGKHAVTLRVTWRGGTPHGAVIGACGERVMI